MRYQIKLDLATITWLVELIDKEKTNCLSRLERFKRIASGEHGLLEEHGYKSKEEFDEAHVKFTKETLAIANNCDNFIDETNRVLTLELKTEES